MKLSITRAHSYAAGVAAVLLAAGAIGGAFGWRELPRPFVWFDVAVLYYLAALPLAASLTVAALLQLPLRRSALAMIVVEAAALLLIPPLYIHARCQRDLKEAIELSRQSRYLEASALMHRVMAFSLDAQVQGTSLARVADRMDQIVREIELSIAAPLAEHATDAERLDRAEKLAMLGRTSQALAVLDSAPLAHSPDACSLRGTIYETRAAWQVARDWYGRAKEGSRSLPDSSAKTVALSRALTGLAFCERKLGRLHQAEAAWQELLALSPTADTHFLVAQFYEDTQQAAKAQYHAQQAMQLAPDNNVRQIQCRQLLNKLVTSHFSCLGIFAADNRQSSTVPAITLPPLSK